MRLTHAQVLRPQGLEHNGAVGLANGIITDHAGKDIDLSGYMILPGIVDLHGDGFERHLAPRRGMGKVGPNGLRNVEAELAANGITTAVLAQFYSWEGGMRGPDFAKTMAQTMAQTPTATDLRLQLRVEICMVDDYPDILKLVDEYAIGYVVFNDHIPHDALAKTRTPPRLTGQALKAGRSPQAHHALLQTLHENTARMRSALPDLAQALMQRGLTLGSHDDATPESRAFYHAMGAHIAEFPETAQAAQAAKQAGDAVLMGAPNVVRGASHKKKQSALDLVMEGGVDGLVSDYHYPALHLAAMKLMGLGMPFAQVWAMISTGPARILGLLDRGEITPGKRADLTIVNTTAHRIEGTICQGQFTYLTGALAARVLAA
jgi:alpha-D-ribose 1-methylphosphonate 5-triphosphate diphosphatase